MFVLRNHGYAPRTAGICQLLLSGRMPHLSPVCLAATPALYCVGHQRVWLGPHLFCS